MARNLLPEVLASIARYLDPDALISSSIACRAWSRVLTPIIWHYISMRTRHRNFTDAAKPAMGRNGHLVRELDLDIMDNNWQLPSALAHCTRLTSIQMQQAPSRPHRPELEDGHWERITVLVQQNPGLQRIELRAPFSLFPTLGFWKAIKASTSLRTLCCVGMVIGSEGTMDAFLECCGSLQSLALSHIMFMDPVQANSRLWRAVGLNSTLTPPPPPPPPPLFPRLECLNLYGSSKLDFDFLSLCLQSPKLRTLSWATASPSIDAAQTVTQLFVRSVANNRNSNLINHHHRDQCQALTSLETLYLSEKSKFPDPTLQTMLKSLVKPLKSLNLSNSRFGVLAFDALCHAPFCIAGTRSSSHLLNLQCLNLMGCVSVTSEMIQHILCSCVALKDLQVSNFSARVIARAQGERKEAQWACLGLKSFKAVLVDFEGLDAKVRFTESHTGPNVGLLLVLTSQEIHQAVHHELGRLLWLETLELAGQLIPPVHPPGAPNPLRESPRSPYTGLAFRMCFGMAFLAGLKRLGTLNVNMTGQELEREDFEWMLDHFPWLNVIAGSLTPWREKEVVFREIASQREKSKDLLWM